MVATSKSPSIHKNTVYQKRDFFMESLFFCKKTNFRLLCHTVFIEIKEAKELLFSELKCHLYGAKPNWRDISEIKYRGKVIYQR